MPHTVRIERVDEPGPANAGLARRRAMALGARMVAPAATAALLTTDADTVPAPDWIATTCRALAVADVVTGRIERQVDGDHPVQDRLEHYYDRLHALRRRIDPVAWEDPPAHYHSGGASLAFRAAAYHAVGGFEPRACGEDAAIIDTAQRLGLRVRRDRAVVVTTSSRRVGRASGGLADHLARLSNEEVTVVHPVDAAWQYRGHAAARAAFDLIDREGSVQRLATLIASDPEHVRRVAAETVNAEAFAIRVVPAVPGGARLVPLIEAERALDQLDSAPRERAA